MNTFPNGVYGINLTKRLSGPDIATLALLTEMTNTYEELDAAHGGDGLFCVGTEVYQLFHQRLQNYFKAQRIYIPSLAESKEIDTFVFRIHRVDSDADINDDEGFDPLDLILGIGILGFPNDIKLTAGFRDAAAWHLWTVI